MEVHINYLGVLLAGVSSMLVGAIYYADQVLGKDWKRLSKVDVKKFEKQMPKLMPMIFLAALLTALIMAHFMYYAHAFSDDSWMMTGIQVSLWAWLGFSATTLFIHNVMDLKSSQLTAIAMGNRLLSFLAMGLVLGWLHP